MAAQCGETPDLQDFTAPSPPSEHPRPALPPSSPPPGPGSAPASPHHGPGSPLLGPPELPAAASGRNPRRPGHPRRAAGPAAGSEVAHPRRCGHPGRTSVNPPGINSSLSLPRNPPNCQRTSHWFFKLTFTFLLPPSFWTSTLTPGAFTSTLPDRGGVGAGAESLTMHAGSEEANREARMIRRMGEAPSVSGATRREWCNRRADAPDETRTPSNSGYAEQREEGQPVGY